MRAAVEVGAACGIHGSEPALLQETNNTVVWLRPSPVVAKVATRPDSKLDARLEHAVASELAALGADVAVPLPGLEPVEHLPTGFVVTLWVRLERVDAQAADRSLSSSLAALHVSLARTRTKLPSFRVELTRARRALDDDRFMAALGPPDRTFLRGVYDAGLAELDGVDLDRQRLHGEPHGGNRRSFRRCVGRVSTTSRHSGQSSTAPRANVRLGALEPEEPRPRRRGQRLHYPSTTSQDYGSSAARHFAHNAGGM